MKVKWLPFSEAHKITLELCREHGIKKQKDWFVFCKSGNKPSNIPRSANIVYKDKAWESYGHWLGTGSTSGGQSKYIVDHSFFKTWTSNMAYVYGFWFADGCIGYSYGSGWRFRISQNKDQKELIKSIAKSMQSNHPIVESKENSLDFTINSKEIYEDIVFLGGKERKSLDCAFPNIPDEYFWDFFRGLFDGDGCIHKRGCHVVSGSKDFIDGLCGSLDKRIPKFKGRLTVIPPRETCINGLICKFSRTYRIDIPKSNSIFMRESMYSNNTELYMNKKRNKFSDLGEIRCNYKKRDGVEYGV